MYAKYLATFCVSLLCFAPITETLAATETKTATVRAAIIDAVQDAKKYNAIPWGIGGTLATPVSVCCNLSIVLWAPYSLDVPLLTVYNNKVGCVACLSAIPTITLLMSYGKKVSPPAERLMGKPPEYVSLYVKTYEQRVKRKRLKYAMYGCAGGSILTVLVIGYLNENVSIGPDDYATGWD